MKGDLNLWRMQLNGDMVARQTLIGEGLEKSLDDQMSVVL